MASGGEAGGKVKVEMMLEEGIRFLGEVPKISFTADVSNKGYTFVLMFSVGEMPDLGDEDQGRVLRGDETSQEIG